MPLPSPTIYARLLDGSGYEFLPGFADDHPSGVVLAGLTIRWGRESVGERNQPTTATFDFYDPTGQWGRTQLFLGRFFYVYYRPTDTTQYKTFAGRITDLIYDPETQITTVAATDWIGEWGNRFVGGAPMALDTMVDRINAIRSRAGNAFQAVVGGTTNFKGLDASSYNARVGAVDWDRRSLTEVLDETLDSIDADWFPTTAPSSPTAIMVFSARRTLPMYFPMLEVGAGELRMAGEFSQRVGDLATAVAIQFNGGAGLGTYYREVDTAAVTAYGERTATVTCHLYDPPGETGFNVAGLAGRVLSRSKAPYWKMPAILTDESLMATPGFAEHLLRRDYAERVLEVNGIAPTVPFPLNAESGAYLRVIGGEARHDGKQWSFSLSTIRHGALAGIAGLAPPG